MFHDAGIVTNALLTLAFNDGKRLTHMLVFSSPRTKI